MANGRWSDYAQEYNDYLASLPPGAKAAIDAFTNFDPNKNPGVGGVGAAADQQSFQERARAELVRSGLSGSEADSLLRAGLNINKFGTAAADDAFLGGPDALKGFQTLSQKRQAAAGAAADEAGKRNISGQIQTFIDSMLGPMDPNDPVRLSLLRSGTDAAQASAGRAGLNARSGLAGTQAAGVVGQAIGGYESQRKAMGLQGQSLLNQRDISLGQLQQGQVALQNQAEGAKWDAQQNTNQAIGGAIGGGLGALGFIGGPALGAATMAGGSALGAGLAGAAGAGTGPAYKTGSYGGSSLGGSGRNPFTGY